MPAPLPSSEGVSVKFRRSGGASGPGTGETKGGAAGLRSPPAVSKGAAGKAQAPRGSPQAGVGAKLETTRNLKSKSSPTAVQGRTQSPKLGLVTPSPPLGSSALPPSSTTAGPAFAAGQFSSAANAYYAQLPGMPTSSGMVLPSLPAFAGTGSSGLTAPASSLPVQPATTAVAGGTTTASVPTFADGMTGYPGLYRPILPQGGMFPQAQGQTSMASGLNPMMMWTMGMDGRPYPAGMVAGNPWGGMAATASGASWCCCVYSGSALGVACTQPRLLFTCTVLCTSIAGRDVRGVSAFSPSCDDIVACCVCTHLCVCVCEQGAPPTPQARQPAYPGR